MAADGRKTGSYSQNDATKRIEHLTVADKNELLFSYGVNFNDLPAWQKRGIGLYWQEVEKEGLNPTTGETVLVKRNRIVTEYELPMRDEYNAFIADLIGRHEKQPLAL